MRARWDCAEGREENPECTLQKLQIPNHRAVNCTRLAFPDYLRERLLQMDTQERNILCPVLGLPGVGRTP